MATTQQKAAQSKGAIRVQGVEGGGLSRCECPEDGQGAARPWGPLSRDGFNSGEGVLEEVLNDLRARIRAGRPPRKRGSYATQTKTKTKGVETT